ncbi:RDD family protein [Candidatus Mycobacterium methanotrophicum]|uniref:RDD family protein n=1 Tax=Candidatus Mycobacterium methanotrophicum TaxID=2943498 RepID=A0ABY4QT72_9MYCO|nr:RDD family protein [Candidatus Mycobacterium methanotrophicum]UQX13306.1 RDD family protein [Candidatus Mycobacterium methanotrophicum]
MSSSPDAPQEVEEIVVNAPAPWWIRAVALAVDVLPGAAVVTTMALAALTVPLRGVWWWSCVSAGGLVILLTAGSRSLLPSITGWSLGRAALGIAVVRSGDGAAVGPWRLLMRDLAHLLDTVSVFVGWLWPLWDQRRRTFADMLVRTEVRRAELRRLPRNVPALVAVVFLTAALLCVSGAAVSYLVVYQHDRATEVARAQIALQGPKIVKQMLTYDPKSLQDDFTRAQSLTTDKYREQLVTQQQAVQKAKLVPNEYWVTDSSVLSASPHRATMLLFLQGERGDPGKERPISATVRVTFANSSGAQWRVDDLTVVTKPLPAEDGK